VFRILANFEAEGVVTKYHVKPLFERRKVKPFSVTLAQKGANFAICRQRM